MSFLIQRRLHGLGAGFMLAALMASFGAYSQEPGDNAAAAVEMDELEPAVDTSEAIEAPEKFEPAVNTSEAIEAPDELEPAVPTAVLAADVTRSQTNGGVMDRMELGRTEITGNQELPKVLYIVPWKKADPGDLMGKPVNSLLDEVLAPIDREEFVRTVDYYGDLYGTEEDD